MNCIIIEDTRGAVEHLENLLKKSGYTIEIDAKLDTVEAAVKWLTHNHTDLIFLDIQLGDGLSFEIFDNIQVTTPVIFTTSYNEYAIKAFEVNSIAYLLKPIMLEDLVQSLQKYEQLVERYSDINKQLIPLQQGFQKKLLVQSGAMMVPVSMDTVAHFRTHNGRYVLVTTNDKHQYLLDNKLEILELRLDPGKFFRINRQYIVNSEAIESVSAADNGRLKINISPDTKEEMFIPKEKVAAFKSWLTR